MAGGDLAGAAASAVTTVVTAEVLRQRPQGLRRPAASRGGGGDGPDPWHTNRGGCGAAAESLGWAGFSAAAAAA